MEPKYVTIEEAARMVGLAKQTLHNWVSQGRLTPEKGLRRLGRRTNIELPIFIAAIERGEI